jgi:hypothetical protein
MNYVLQDGAFIFQDFRMGVMAVSNNIPMLVMGLQDLKMESKAAGKSGIGTLIAALKGPAGLGFAVSAGVFALQSLTFLLSSTKKEAKAAAEANKELKKSFDDLSKDAYSGKSFNLVAQQTYDMAQARYKQEPNQRNVQAVLEAAKLLTRSQQPFHALSAGASAEAIKSADMGDLIRALRFGQISDSEREDIEQRLGGEFERYFAKDRIYGPRSMNIGNKGFLDPKSTPKQTALDLDAMTVSVDKNTIAFETNRMNLINWQGMAVTVGRTIDQHLTFALMNGANAADALGKAFEQMGQKILAELIGKGILYLIGSLFGLSAPIMNGFVGGGITGALFTSSKSIAPAAPAVSPVIVLEGTLDGQTFLQKSFPKYNLTKSREVRRLGQ